ncbi:hypothetical protein BDM02DRAFT_3130702 [Thelephora ganbajun]|uniref:Uncharacterized protein n=1 Tax=Thelephora ganbajun TaxID=370292 RepID=A0ACB6Z8M4_THEGA|nr:hypothetical protein BDM02DRAFT_3130702 [Thelephora ganbajun]
MKLKLERSISGSLFEETSGSSSLTGSLCFDRKARINETIPLQQETTKPEITDVFPVLIPRLSERTCWNLDTFICEEKKLVQLNVQLKRLNFALVTWSIKDHGLSQLPSGQYTHHVPAGTLRSWEYTTELVTMAPVTCGGRFWDNKQLGWPKLEREIHDSAMGNSEPQPERASRIRLSACPRRTPP